MKVSDKLMAGGVDSDPGVISTIQAISLYADVASFCASDVVMQVYSSVYPNMIQLASQKTEEWQLL